MAGSSADALLGFGLGGFAALLWSLWLIGNRLAGRAQRLRALLESALKNLRTADLASLLEEIRAVEADAKSLIGLLRRGR
jgi:hypothetical protein